MTWNSGVRHQIAVQLQCVHKLFERQILIGIRP